MNDSLRFNNFIIRLLQSIEVWGRGGEGGKKELDLATE